MRLNGETFEFSAIVVAAICCFCYSFYELLFSDDAQTTRRRESTQRNAEQSRHDDSQEIKRDAFNQRQDDYMNDLKNTEAFQKAIRE